jgi:CheY-like chemotaxis protein
MAKILIVEDEYIIAESMQEILLRLDHEVVEIVSSGAKALNKLKESEPDMILMDINLKGDMDGIETAHKIKEQFDIPVIYITAYGNNELIERAQITEPYGYLLKPLKERELRSTIKMALYKSQIDKKLASVKAMLLTVFNSIGIGIIITDINGNVILMNSISAKITGISKDSAIGKPIGEVFDLKEIVEEDSSPDEGFEMLPSEALNKQLAKGNVPKKIINFGINNNAIIILPDKNNLSVYGSISPVKTKKEIIGSVIAFQRVGLNRTSNEEHGMLKSGIKTDISSLIDASNEPKNS